MQSIDQNENRRVLVIDDNRAIHEDIRKILCPNTALAGSASLSSDAAMLFGGAPVAAPLQAAPSAFEMDSAFQGQEGLDKVRETLAAGRPYALAFVDGRMPPGWDGIETIARLWQIYPELQVVICTAYSDYSWEQIVRHIGQSESLVILKKPFDTVEVLQLAHSMTSRWMLNQQVRARAGQLNRLIEERTVELEQTHKQLLESSRQAGMAEVAAGALHNVGNVLNSVNVASSCMAQSLKTSKVANLSKVVTMLKEHEGDLGTFITSDPKGKQVPGYLAQLAEHLAGERATSLKELAQLQKNIEHIKEVVAAQQSGAKRVGKPETLRVTDLVEDTLRMDSGGEASHDIQVIRQFEDAPPINVEKHKVLQILMNLVRNAKQACHEADRPEKRLTLRVSNGDNRVRIAVSDNGVGISPENLARIFAHGFTTKKDGHGFGLHSAAAAAKEMGGSLNVQSEGIGHGATFTLELPM